MAELKAAQPISATAPLCFSARKAKGMHRVAFLVTGFILKPRGVPSTS